MAKTTAQIVCKNNWLFACLYKSLPSACFLLLYNFLFMCNALVFCLKKQDIFFLEKAVLILILYHLFIVMFIYIQRFVIKNYIYKTIVIIWPCHILYSEITSVI